MLELHHGEANGASARVLIALAEKGLEFQSHYVNVLSRAQHASSFLALNPLGEVPVLVDDGVAMTESSFICEYLEDAYPGRPLMPAEPLARWAVRGWQKFVDDYFAGAVSDLAWEAFRGRVDAAMLAAGAASAPTEGRRQVWREHATAFPPERLANARDYVTQGVARMDEALARAPWLAGEAFTLADIAMSAWAAYLPRVMPGAVTPTVRDWLDRIGKRDAVRRARAAGRSDDPFALAAPGPEHTRWG